MSMPETHTPKPAPEGLEPGSFRDPESRVFYSGGDVYRALSADGLSDFEALQEAGLLEHEYLVGTERAAEIAALENLLVHKPAAVLRHERIPFVSYPYEWTFSMLKDAALVQLDLLLAALEHDLVLKDSTPYNVQFEGARPLFVDIGSFERLREGEAWVGYRQFCMLYLYPLLAPVGEGRALPALVARLDRRHHAERDASPHVVPRPLPQGDVHQRLPARAPREALRRPPG